MKKKYNVLLVVADQMRRDALGVNGKEFKVHTPHLDQLASEGINFTNARTAAPSCIAARAGLFTGLTPTNHGFVGYDAKVEWKYQNTLPGLLTKAGYQSCCVGKMHVEPARNHMGFEQVILHDGFLHDKRRDYGSVEEYDDYLPWLKMHDSTITDICDTGLGCNGYAARTWIGNEMLHPTNFVTTKAIDFIKRRDTTRPFFLKVSYHRPHSPLDPPQAFYDMYDGMTLPPPLAAEWNSSEFVTYTPENPIPTDSASQDRARKAYYALVSQIDYSLNRLFITLADKKLWDDTLIIFVSDHGDMLFDHHAVRKSIPFESSVGIPLFMKLPRDFKPELLGHSDDRLAEIRDLLPTICDVCDLPIDFEIDGESLIQPTQRQVFHGEHCVGINSNQFLTDNKQKYCWFSKTGRELLFDLVNDPNECCDISAQNPEDVAKWRVKMVELLKDRPEGFVVNNQLTPTDKGKSSLPWAGVGKA